VIILNWNGLAHLPDCLASLAAQTFRDFEVILIDNGSEDGSVEYVRTQFPWVKIFPLPHNIGFAAGNNRGLQHASGRYIVTLNNDTRADPKWLELLVDVADRMPEVGMIASRICCDSNPDKIDSIGMAICTDGMSRGRLRNRLWSRICDQELSEILLPSACAALYRKTMIDEIGFFDEDFFAYAEDTDLGLRGRLAGWQAIAATEAIVYHKYSQTSGSFSPFKLYLVERNHFWVVIKNFPVTGLMALPWTTLRRYFEQLRVVLRGTGAGSEFCDAESRGTVVRCLLKGIWDSLLGLPRMWQKRRQVLQTRRLPWKEFARLLRRHRVSFRELLDSD